MNTGKIVKYFGIALAAVIIINICIFLIQITAGIGSFLDEDEKKELSTKYIKKIDKELDTYNENSLKKIDIELGASTLTIVNTDGDIKVDTNNDYVEVREHNNELSIKERTHFFNNNKNIETILYLPSNIKLDKFEIDMGAGETHIDYLNAFEVDIETGAGRFTLNDSNINKIDLNLGVGEVTINGNISSGDIDAGVGSLTLNLTDTMDMYRFLINKGLGEININNETVSNGSYGNGFNTIEIDGGIGTINVNTK